MQMETQRLDAIEKNYRGVQALENNKTQDAINFFNEALTIDPFYKSATQNLETSKVEVKGGLLFADFSAQKNKKEKQIEALILIIDDFVKNYINMEISEYALESDINNPDNATINVEVKFSSNKKLSCISTVSELFKFSIKLGS